MEWKKRKEEKRILDIEKKKKEEEKKSKNKGQLKTGKELFTYDPTLFVDDKILELQNMIKRLLTFCIPMNTLYWPTTAQIFLLRATI